MGVFGSDLPPGVKGGGIVSAVARLWPISERVGVLVSVLRAGVKGVGIAGAVARLFPISGRVGVFGGELLPAGVIGIVNVEGRLPPISWGKGPGNSERGLL